MGSEAHDPTGRARVPGSPSTRTTAHDRASYAPALNRGYGDAMGRGLELALTLLVMVGVGWVLDRAFGTAPWCTIVLSVAGFAGIGVKLWMGYDLEMRKHDEGAVWSRGRTGQQGSKAA